MPANAHSINRQLNPGVPEPVDKGAGEPAYSRLASRLRHMTADGTFQPGSRIPPETNLCKQFALSLMTVRRAIAMLTEEGLLKPLQGRGTFVQSIEWQNSGFNLRPLADLVDGDSDNTKVRLLTIKTVRAEPEQAALLSVAAGARLILIERLLLRDGQPVLLQSGHLIYDPRQPLVEAELNIISLSGFFTGSSNTTIKRGRLDARPKILTTEESERLRRPSGSAAFALDYLFWNFQDLPASCGSFLVPEPFLTLSTRIGLWLGDEPDGD
jgi:DNA-binding GntR family transcriptional regulator